MLKRLTAGAMLAAIAGGAAAQDCGMFAPPSEECDAQMGAYLDSLPVVTAEAVRANTQVPGWSVVEAIDPINDHRTVDLVAQAERRLFCESRPATLILRCPAGGWPVVIVMTECARHLERGAITGDLFGDDIRADRDPPLDADIYANPLIDLVAYSGEQAGYPIIFAAIGAERLYVRLPIESLYPAVLEFDVSRLDRAARGAGIACEFDAMADARAANQSFDEFWESAAESEP